MTKRPTYAAHAEVVTFTDLERDQGTLAVGKNKLLVIEMLLKFNIPFIDINYLIDRNLACIS